MEIRICKNPDELGKSAATYVAEILRGCIAEKGEARIALSTGASQFDTIAALIKEDVDWSRVEMFHLDEYVGLDERHKASFRKYLKERFISKVNLKAAHLVEADPACIPELTEEIRRSPIDVGLIGIGENAHIAFNDPPADFDTEDAYIVVNLNDTCKRQQVGEGWFATVDDVPKQAISMSVRQILSCRHIVSCVPYAVKAKAVHATMTNKTTNTVPATILKGHDRFVLYVDKDSAKDILTGDVAL
ncbi:MAG: 6-phosphogluconolactonase [Clostridia bacterium]|nr:6-phosphogluconolactonase [Clostridia bacterium]